MHDNEAYEFLCHIHHKHKNVSSEDEKKTKPLQEILPIFFTKDRHSFKVIRQILIAIRESNKRRLFMKIMLQDKPKSPDTPTINATCQTLTTGKRNALKESRRIILIRNSREGVHPKSFTCFIPNKGITTKHYKRVPIRRAKMLRRRRPRPRRRRRRKAINYLPRTPR